MKKTFFALSSLAFCILYTIISLVTLVVLALLPSRTIRRVYSKMDAKEEAKRIENMKPFVREGFEILDVGAGSCRFGKAVQDALKAKVSGVDVCDYSDGIIPFFVFDGNSLPFPDRSFDVVFFAFVLHHTTNQTELLREACRVARQKVILFEDTYDWPWERLFVAWNDFHTNILQGWIKAKKGHFKGDPTQMPMPYTFRSVPGWKDLFTTLPVTMTSCAIRRAGYKPLQKVTFCLDLS